MRDDELYDEEEWAAIQAWSPQRPAPGVAGWRRTSAVGAVLAGTLLGLREALEPPVDDEQAVVVDHAGPDLDPEAPVEVWLDPETPAASVAVLRTWVVRPPA